MTRIPKTMRMWAVILRSSDGRRVIEPHTVRPTRRASIASYVMHAKEWRDLRRWYGYTCERVVVTRERA